MFTTARFPFTLTAGLWLACSLAGCGKSPSEPVSAISPGGAPAAPVANIDVGDDDWPWWRGVNQDGDAGPQNIVASWSEDEHVLWKAEVPGRGHSSPVVCNERVFLTTADEKAETQSILCYDLATGRAKWNTIVNRGGFPTSHQKNSHASATPACDGRRVFAAFVAHDQLTVTACDLDGNRLWQQSVGPFHSEHGYGPSPVLFDAFVILSGDSRGIGYVAALNRETGEIAWRTPRDASEENGNYATPLARELAGRAQLVLAGFDKVASYDPRTGQKLWSVDGPTRVMANSIAANDDFLVVSGGYPDQEILCIRPDGQGDVTDSHILWRSKRHVAYVPSPLIHDDGVLLLTGEGVLANYDLDSGEMRWQQRLGGNYSASITRAGELFLVPDEAGKTTVFRVQPEFQKVSVNELADKGGMATPTICNGKILIRTDHRLYCIGQ